ncbi:MAG: hypothetical protein IPK53_11840 [bacterium]|nr:hypothetical protein [bacterium]
MTGLARTLREKWYLDDAYGAIVHKFYLPLTALLQKFELAVIKGALDGIGFGSMRIARSLATVQTGEVQHYVLVSFVVVAAVVIILMSR